MASRPFEHIITIARLKHLYIAWFGFSIRFEFQAYRGVLHSRHDKENNKFITLSEAYYLRFEIFGLLVKFIFPVKMRVND